MSWDCYLWQDDQDRKTDYPIGSWDYTYNTTPMINTALQAIDIECEHSWHELLHGKTGPEGAMTLKALVTELERAPALYRLQNPANGWGSYEGLLEVLRDMATSVPECPTHWEFL